MTDVGAIGVEFASASAVIGVAIGRAIAPKKPMTVSEWADLHRRLSTKGSALAGRWQTSRNPPLREPMDMMSARSSVREGVLKFPIQFGKTEVALAVLGYTMEHYPGPVMVCLPGEVSRDKWIAQKLQPMLDESPAVRDTLTSTSSREAANRRDFKDFLGGQLYLEHAGSPQRLKSTSVRTLIVDEVDEFAASLSSGDDPIEMLEGRTSAFPSTCRRLYISTPTLRHASRIEWLYDRSDKRRYYVPCPHCGHEQPLVWSGLRWGPGGTGVHYVCEDCGAEIAEHHKTAMIAAGRWVAEAPGARTVGYALNGLYYQIGLGPRWAELVAKWLEAQDDPAKLKTFVNDRLAETWEDPSMRAVRHDAVADRAESYPLRTVPSGGLALTAGVDTQDNRLAVQIVAWGSGMRCWVLDYVELPGDPAAGAVWDALTDLLTQPLQCEEGGTLHVLATAIDAGGHRTEAVKDFVRQRRITRPMAIFGAVPNNAPILSRPKAQDVHWRGGVDKSGVVIYHVGTVAAKHWLYGRLSADAERPPEMRHVHTTDHLPREYFGMLTSETFDPRKNRFAKRRGARNEGLDTWVYAFAAAHHPELRLHRATGADWARMADRVRTATVIADTPTVVTRHIDASPARKPAPASGGRAW